MNQIAHSSNDRLEHDVDVCAEHEVPITITSLRAPKFVVDKMHAAVGKNANERFPVLVKYNGFIFSRNSSGSASH